MKDSGLATPLAVMAGSCLIALVLFRGLDRVAEMLSQRPLAPAVASPTLSAPSPPAMAAAPKAAATQESPAEVSVRRAEQAQFTFIRQAPDYVRACWKPKPAVPGEQPDLGGAFELDITFDAGGLETGRVVRTGGYAKPALLECVKATKLPRLQIPPPGEPFTTVVRMPIP